MPNRVAISTLNASTIDILNVIRQNASAEYQNLVPVVTKEQDIPAVGEVLHGYPALANQFLNALVNRIGLVRAKSALFNNPYAMLKKGYLEYGETIEEIFIGIAEVLDYSAEKAESREFKRTIPDVRSAFHVMNWRVLYPVTIQEEDLKKAFLSVDGVSELITKIIDSLYTAANYDEFLLFKYLIIKAVSHGKMFPVATGSGTDLKDAAKAFRGYSNSLTFMNENYNEAGVKTVTPRDRQVIFMDSMFNAEFDVDVLAGAFNMGKAEFMGRLILIDDFTSFDNKRWEVIRKNSTAIEEVTSNELALMGNVKAILLDEDWFQVYDDLFQFKETPVGSGLYWNYWLHSWKTVSYSPFANAIAFVGSEANISLPDSVTVTVTDKSESEFATVLTLMPNVTEGLMPSDVEFVQTEALTQAGIAVHKYGAVMIPKDKASTEIQLVVRIKGQGYRASTNITANQIVSETVTLNADN